MWTDITFIDIKGTVHYGRSRRHLGLLLLQRRAPAVPRTNQKREAVPAPFGHPKIARNSS